MNPIALDFIKARESCRLTAYDDGTGRWTVGWGATGPDIGPGTVWSQEQADLDLANRVGAVETNVLMKTAPIRPSPQQAAALISFAYNVGLGAFGGSTLLKCVLCRHWLSAAKEFLAWDRAGGAESQGLFKRRCYEAALFLEGS